MKTYLVGLKPSPSAPRRWVRFDNLEGALCLIKNNPSDYEEPHLEVSNRADHYFRHAILDALAGPVAC